MECGNNFGPIESVQTEKIDKSPKKRSFIPKKDKKFINGLKKGFKIEEGDK